MIHACYNKDQPAVDLSPIAQLSELEWSDPMVLVLQLLSSHDALESRTVCTRWNQLISSRCIALILCRELEPQLALFLQHIGKTFNQYFLSRRIHLPSLDSVRKAYDVLAPISWRVSLKNCIGVPDLAQITPQSVLQNIQYHFTNHPWNTDEYLWRKTFQEILSQLGFPASTWNQLALAVGVPAQEWNQQLEGLLLSASMPPGARARLMEVLGVKPGSEESGFDPLAITGKVSNFLHSKVGQAPYCQLCERYKKKPPKSTEGLVSIDDDGNDDSDDNDEEPISFHVNGQVLYDYFPCTLLGFKEEDYVGKKILSLGNSIIEQDFCFPIYGRFFKFTIRPAQTRDWNPEKEQKGSSDSSSDDDYIVNNCETKKRKVTYSGWKCILFHLYVPEDEFERTKQTDKTIKELL
jgi:hypothetical protein